MVPCQGCSSENLVLNVLKTKHIEQQSNIVMIRFIAAQIVFESDARMDDLCQCGFAKFIQVFRSNFAVILNQD